MLTFHFFKHGSNDPKMSRPHDAMLRLRMSAIIYVHTHRFYSELMCFFNQFQQLQAVMNRIREAAAGVKVQEVAARGMRLKLDIEASGSQFWRSGATDGAKWPRFLMSISYS